MTRQSKNAVCLTLLLSACSGGNGAAMPGDANPRDGDAHAEDGAFDGSSAGEDGDDAPGADGAASGDGADVDVPGDPDAPEPPRRAPVAGLPDFSHAGYRGGMALPGDEAVMTVIDAAEHGVVANDGEDDSAALQEALDAAGAVAGRDFDHLVVLQLPAGRIDLREEIHVDQSFVVVRGQGSARDAAGSTVLVVRPSPAMRVEALTDDGSAPGYDAIREGPASGGWLWPGRGAFRVQTRAVHPAYAEDYARAPEGHRDLFEGTVNVHWKAGLRVAQDAEFAGRAGETTLRMESVAGLSVGQSVWVGAANSRAFYEDTFVHQESYWLDGHMRAQVFTLRAVDAATRTVTLDQPLEFDVPANSREGGSPAIASDPYYSKLVPLTTVRGVGFEHFVLTYDLNGLPRLNGETIALTREQAVHEYGNLAPEYALHGIVFKWAEDAWVRDVHIDMAASHPLVTEVARHVQVEFSRFTGAWNKGKGGNGYLRGSRVWNSLYRNNVLRDLRHFTFQWSASGNVATHNDLDCDVNFHGGWERVNLVEHNVIRVPFGHRPGRCTVNCGSEGGGTDEGDWYPLWWGAGAKAGKWSGATGPRNILFHNVMAKQTVEGGPFESYAPYDVFGAEGPFAVVQLGWSSDGAYLPLSQNGAPIADWSGHETVDYTAAPNAGVEASQRVAGESLFYDLP